jgi:hypothetical protein
MLSKIQGVVDPEAFAALMEIFETAWAEISRTGKISAQDVPKARVDLATLVMEQMDRSDLFDVEKMRDGEPDSTLASAAII